METRILDKTPLSFAYALFYSSSDQGIISTFSWLVSGTILATIIWNLIGTVNYGKASSPRTTTTSSSKKLQTPGKIFKKLWEFPIPSRFTWRYGFIPSVIVPWVVILFSPAPYLFSPLNLCALAIFYIHYFNRSVIYPSKISNQASPSPLWFYIFVSLATTTLGFVETHHLANLLTPQSPSIFTLIAIGMSIVGALINNHHDGLLTQLRAKGQGYQIPTGGLFDLVSCANYFGEVMEWWGFALVTNGGLPQVMFALFSTVFLVMRARFTHHWYKTTFGSKYPHNRKAIIPFIY